MTYRKRALTALVAGAVALPFLSSSALAAPGDTEPPPVQDIRVFCTNPITPQFTDVRSTDVFALDIRCIATARALIGEIGITEGGPEGRPASQYGPERPVTRGQMASFIARMIDAADARDRGDRVQALPGYDGSNAFTDVPNDFVHVANINRLADAGIARGGPAGRPANIYRPNDPITRAQMASFLNRAAAFVQGENPRTSVGFTTSSDFYTDDENIQVHEPNINGITSVGIANGVGNRQFDPGDPDNPGTLDNPGRGTVTRAQMAGFIARELSQFFDEDRIFSVLELLSERFDAGSREDTGRLATPETEGDDPSETRTYTATGLEEDVEFRVTLVPEENVQRLENGLVQFEQDGDTGLAATGNVTADILDVNGGAPRNNAGAGTTSTDNDVDDSRSIVTETDANGTITFTIEGDAGESVVPVLYVNGGAGRGLDMGGNSPRLELDGRGLPVEYFGIGGVTDFAAQAPTVEDGRVATDAAIATDGEIATNTATEGDFFELAFSEDVTTDGAVIITFHDEDSTFDTGEERVTFDFFTIVCDDAGDGVDDGNTAADCTIDGDILTIELLEDPTITGSGDGTATFPLEFEVNDGVVADDDGEPPRDSGILRRDERTVETDDPSPGP
jgi:hypothetical protein